MLDNIIGSIPTVGLVAFIVLSLVCFGVFVYLLVGPARRSSDHDDTLLAIGLALVAVAGTIACGGTALTLSIRIGNWFILIASVSALIGLAGIAMSIGAAQRIARRLDETARQIMRGNDRTKGPSPR